MTSRSHRAYDALPTQVSALTVPSRWDGLQLAPVTRAATHPRRAMLTTVRPDPRVWATAVQLAHGDTSRLLTQPDGSVIVANRPVRAARRRAG